MVDSDDMEWMAHFTATNANDSQSRVPTTSRTAIDGISGSSRHKRKRDEDDDDGDYHRHGDHDDPYDDDINALFGGNLDRSDSEDEKRQQKPRQQPPPRPKKPPELTPAEQLRQMLAKEGTRVLPTSSKGTAGTPTVAEALRNHREQSDSSSSDDDDGPRPVPMRQKFEETTRKRYVPVTYDTVDSSEDDSSDVTDGEGNIPTPPRGPRMHKRECFLCAFGDRFHDGIEAPLVNRLHAIFEMNYGKVENAALAQMLHLYFKKRIHTKGMAMLTQEIALEHIEQMHTLDPRITVGELIRHYMRMFLTFEDEIYLSDGSFNRHAIAAMNAAGRMILSLYKSDPVKMNFYNPKMDIDTKQMGNFTNIMSVFTTRKKEAPIARKRSRSPSSSPARDGDRPSKRRRTDKGSSSSPEPSPLRSRSPSPGRRSSDERPTKRARTDFEPHLFF